MSFRIIHFNDVYNVSPSEQGDNCGGAARLVEAIRSYKPGGKNYDGRESIVLFSGDCFFPSILSQITLAKHIPPVLNKCQVVATCLGNHDLDSGTYTFTKRAKQCDFPWLAANFKAKETNKPMPEPCQEYVIIDVPLNDSNNNNNNDVSSSTSSTSTSTTKKSLKIGIIGLVELAWIDCLSSVEPEDVIYEDFVDCARRLIPKMKSEGAEMIIALTHMRIPNDTRLLEEAGDLIDILLGGHDHSQNIEKVEKFGKYFVKSGTDFRSMTLIDVNINAASEEQNSVSTVTTTATSTSSESNNNNNKFNFKFEPINIMRSMPEAQDVCAFLKEYEDSLSERMKKKIGVTSVDLDCRFEVIRSRESNISNFVADCVRWSIPHPKPDVVLINSGTLRTDAIVAAGDYTLRDLFTLLPMLDPLVVIKMKAEQIIEALENGVSKTPALEGRFPIVSGVRFKFDIAKEPGNRVVPGSVFIGGKPLDNEKTYNLATKEYLASGKDGYNVFENCEVVVDAENLTSLCQAVQRYFLVQFIASKFASVGAFHRNTLTVVKSAAQQWLQKTRDSADATSGNGNSEDDDDEEEDGGSPSSPHFCQKIFKMKPKVDGRITQIDTSVKK